MAPANRVCSFTKEPDLIGHPMDDSKENDGEQ